VRESPEARGSDHTEPTRNVLSTPHKGWHNKPTGRTANREDAHRNLTEQCPRRKGASRYLRQSPKHLRKQCKDGLTTRQWRRWLFKYPPTVTFPGEGATLKASPRPRHARRRWEPSQRQRLTPDHAHEHTFVLTARKTSVHRVWPHTGVDRPATDDTRPHTRTHFCLRRERSRHHRI